MSNRETSWRTPLAAAVAVAVAAAAGAGYAAIPGADGKLRACYATTNGLLLGIPHSKGDVRIVDEGEGCRSYERAVSWNQQGAPGRDGVNGVSGVSGWVVVWGPAQTGVAKALCPAGKKPLGGGGHMNLGEVERSFAMDSDQGGEVGWLLDSSEPNAQVTAQVICASVTP